jgi:hypothetical protein
VGTDGLPFETIIPGSTGACRAFGVEQLSHSNVEKRTAEIGNRKINEFKSTTGPAEPLIIEEDSSVKSPAIKEGGAESIPISRKLSRSHRRRIIPPGSETDSTEQRAQKPTQLRRQRINFTDVAKPSRR